MTTLQPSSPRSWLQQLARLLLCLSYGAVCLAFVHMLFLLLFTSVFCNLRECRVDRAWLDIRNIASALKLNWVKTGRYPTTEEGFRALVERGLLESIPRDPWGNEYRYLLWQGCPLVWSDGQDGAPGGEDQDADLGSMGTPPPPWVLQRADLSAPHPPPSSCPWSLKQDGRL